MLRKKQKENINVWPICSTSLDVFFSAREPFFIFCVFFKLYTKSLVAAPVLSCFGFDFFVEDPSFQLKVNQHS